MAFARREAGSPAGAEISLGETRGRMLMLAALGVLLGGVGGVAAFVVVRLVGLISNLALLHRVAFTLPDLGRYHPGPELISVAVGGSLVVALLALWSPVIKGHGIPESIEAIVLRESRIKPRALLAKPLSAAVAMGTGGPFGAEGPIIVTGGTIGSLLGQMLPVSAAERRILLATGAAAGMAGVFDTPVAAVLVAFELLLFERSLRALLPLVLATSLAAELHTVLLGAHPLFAVSLPSTYSAPELPLFCIVGIASGVLAIVLNKGLFAFEAAFRRLPVPEFFHPLIGALGFATIGLAVPGSLSVGYWAIDKSTPRSSATRFQPSDWARASSEAKSTRLRDRRSSFGTISVPDRPVSTASRCSASASPTCSLRCTRAPPPSPSSPWVPASGRRPGLPSPGRCSPSR